MDLLVLADSDGVVDMTHEAIARVTNVPLDEVTKYITELGAPDAKSRSKVEAGRRIILIDSHRDWGWKIVNYQHYRAIRDEESRRAYFRDKQREHRKSKLSNVVKDSQGMLTHADGEEEAEADAEGIYLAYPRKVGKPKALSAIRKALNKIPPLVLIEKTRAFAACQKGADPQFIPHPATWFNQERFNDDPATWKRATNGSAITDRREKIDVPIYRL